MTARFLLLLTFFFSGLQLSQAQSPIIRSLERNAEGQGTVVVEQDARLDEWLRKGVPASPATSSARQEAATDKSATAQPHSATAGSRQGHAAGHAAQADTLTAAAHPSKTHGGRAARRSGFRIQVYSGPATRDSKNRAAAAAEKVRALFPHLSAYPIFVSPRWLCVVGDFLTREEAAKARAGLLETGEFTECSIVRSQILVYL